MAWKRSSVRTRPGPPKHFINVPVPGRPNVGAPESNRSPEMDAATHERAFGMLCASFVPNRLHIGSPNYSTSNPTKGSQEPDILGPIMRLLDREWRNETEVGRNSESNPAATRKRIVLQVLGIGTVVYGRTPNETNLRNS